MAYFDFINTYTSSTPGSLYAACTRSPFSIRCLRIMQAQLRWYPSKVPWQLCSVVRVSRLLVVQTSKSGLLLDLQRRIIATRDSVRAENQNFLSSLHQSTGQTVSPSHCYIGATQVTLLGQPSHWYIAVPCLSVIWVLRQGDRPRNPNKNTDQCRQCQSFTVMLGRPSHKTQYKIETVTLSIWSASADSVTVSLCFRVTPIYVHITVRQ